MISLYFGDNVNKMTVLHNQKTHINLIYADCIYDSADFIWLSSAIDMLEINGIIIIQTDYHTVANYKLMLDQMRLKFVSWVIYKQEWGGVPRDRFPQKHDDILIYSVGNNWKWCGDRIQIPKVTAGTKLDKKGTGLKTPCSVFDDLGNFSTLSKERVKDKNGKCIQWQKPLKLINRLLLPFTDEGDTILDPFMGTNTTGLWCKQNNRNFVGIENDPEIFKIAERRIE